MNEDKSNEFLKRLATLLPRIAITIVWARKVHAPVDLQSKPNGSISAFTSSIVSVLLVGLGTIGMFWFFRFNLLDMQQPLGNENASALLGHLIFVFRHTTEQITNWSTDSSVFVLLVSTVLSLGFLALVTTIVSFRASSSGDRVEQAKTLIYQLLPACTAFFASSIVCMIIGITLSTTRLSRFSYKFHDYLVFALLALAIVCSLVICIRGTWKGPGTSKDHIARKNYTYLLFVLGSVGITMQSALWAERLYPAEMYVAVSSHCGPDQRCLIFLRSRNIGKAVLADSIRLQMSLVPFDSAKKASPDSPIFRQARIWLAPSGEGDMVTLTSGAEQEAYVEKVTLECPPLPASKSSFMVTQVTGGTTVHLPDEGEVNNVQPVPVRFEGVSQGLLNMASDNCS